MLKIRKRVQDTELFFFAYDLIQLNLKKNTEILFNKQVFFVSIYFLI